MDLCSQEITSCGRKISWEKIKFNPEMIERLLSLPEPINPVDLQIFVWGKLDKVAYSEMLDLIQCAPHKNLSYFCCILRNACSRSSTFARTHGRNHEEFWISKDFQLERHSKKIILNASQLWSKLLLTQWHCLIQGMDMQFVFLQMLQNHTEVL